MSDEVLKLIADAERKMGPKNECPKIGKLDFCLEDFTGRYDPVLVQFGETRVRLGFKTKDRYFIREFELKILGSDQVTVEPGLVRRSFSAVGKRIGKKWPSHNPYSLRKF